jgi:hypothetical protein
MAFCRKHKIYDDSEGLINLEGEDLAAKALRSFVQVSSSKGCFGMKFRPTEICDKFKHLLLADGCLKASPSRIQ